MADNEWQDDPADFIKQYLGVPVTVTSGDRTHAKNAAVGGVKDSQHMIPGDARDFVPQGMSTADAAARLAKVLPSYDQIIDEGTHVHVSLDPRNRRQFFAAGANTAPPPMPDYFSSTLPDAPPAKATAAPSQPSNTPDYFSSTLPPDQGTPKPTHAGWRSVGTGVEWYDPNAKGSLANTAVDVARTIPGALAQGAANLAGLPGDIHSLIQSGGDWAIKQANPQLAATLQAARQANPSPIPAPPTSAAINSLISAPTGGYYQPQTVPGQFANTIGQFAPAAAVGGEALLPRIMKNVVLPGATSEASGQATAGTPYEGAARLLGALAPSAMGSAATHFMGANSVNPARAALAERAINDFGIPLRGSQITSHPFPKLLDSTIGKMPFSGMANQNAEQTSAFSRAVTNTFGENASDLSPDVMNKARDRIGKVFDRVGANTTIKADNAFTDRLMGTLDGARVALGDHAVSPIENQIKNVLDVVDKDGTISGQSYQALTRKGAPLDRGMNSNDPNVRHYVTEIRNTLDDALQNSAKPEDLADLREARLQYKNLMTVKDIASKAGVEGEISPALLLQAVRKSYKNMAFTGAGDIGDLANIGQEFLKEAPSSTTAERSLIYKLMRLGAEGTGLAFAWEHPETALAGAGVAAGTLAGGRAIGSLLKSKAYANALLKGARGPTGSNAIPATMLGVHNLLNPQNTNYANVPSQ